MKKSLAVIPIERIQKQILLLRGQKVMLAQHLAGLYGVPVKALNQAVRRNRDRFPDDFMFQVSSEESALLKSQIVTSSWGGMRFLPYGFIRAAARWGTRWAARPERARAQTGTRAARPHQPARREL